MVFSSLFAVIMTLLLGGIAFRLHRAFKLFRIRKNYTAALDAPSVSVCIPARNENHAMTECLERVLASDYRKLEVIVYDDASTDDTSALVRSFAYAGVRFVAGTPLPSGWLGKNHALEVLAREASGTYIVFLDVDTRIDPTTISQLVGYSMTENVDMMSVIPGRKDAWRASVLCGHLRYFWELVLSTAKKPASSSSLWMIKRRVLLETFGGLELLKVSVAPESILASQLGTTLYHCLITNQTLGVNYEKKWSSQVETSQRLLYPKAGSTWWRGLIAILLLFTLNIPLFILLAAPFTGWTLLQVVALWFTFVFMAVYAMYTHHVWDKGWWLGGLLWPFVIFQELILFIRSMYGYMRGTITWKGRIVTKKS